MVLVATLVFLMMRQVMPIAAAIAGGVALNSFGAISRVIDAGAGAVRGIARPGSGYLRAKAGHGLEFVRSRWRTQRDES